MPKLFLILGILVVLTPSAALAQGASVTGFGPRVGFSTGPDQLILGGHMIIGEVAPSITFDPSVDLGLGDNRTTLSLNFDLHYHFVVEETNWLPYVGAGAGIHFTDIDRGPGLLDESETDVGGSLILGAGIPTESKQRFFGEIKLGFGTPDLKFLAGWNFR